MVFLARGGGCVGPSFIGFVDCRWLVQFDLHLCVEKFILLVTRSSIISSMNAWRGPIRCRGTEIKIK